MTKATVNSQLLLFLCKSRNGIDVFFDPVNSHAATHLDDVPQLKDLVIEAIGKIRLEEKEIYTAVDMGRIVGTCDVVEVEKNDEIVYGIRRNRDDDGLVPFVRNREGDSCPYVTVYIVLQEDGQYVLSSAWIGPMSEDDVPFPLSKNATTKSKEYWDKHAFVYGSQEIVTGTETSHKPW